MNIEYNFLVRLASYAIPGAGWIRAAADFVSSGNVAGAFAYDVFTAPRRIPFLLDQDGVSAPFAMNLDKYGFLRYPGITFSREPLDSVHTTIVNTVDPFSNGQYPYGTYFLYGDNVKPENFQPWNINNREATLAASGVAYSYDILAAGRGVEGKNTFDNIIDNKSYYSNGLYALDFKVLRHDNDDPTIQPTTPFTSPLTGVTNAYGEKLNENYFISAFGFNIKNNTDYHLGKMEYWSRAWHHSDENSKPLGDDPVIDHLANSSVVSDAFPQPQDDMYYISFAEAFTESLSQKYGGSIYSDNYGKDRGIVHVTPGAYTIHAGLDILPPDGAKITGSLGYEENHKMFVMANVSNGVSSRLENDPAVIPYISVENSATGTIGRSFELNPYTNSVNFAFKFYRPDNKTIFPFDFNRKIRIAFFLRDASKGVHTEHYFYTLDPQTHNPESDGVYRIPLPTEFFLEKEDGTLVANAGLRLVWYDAVLQEYSKYTGIPESKIVDNLFLRNFDTKHSDAVNKVFMAQSTFDGYIGDNLPSTLGSYGAPVRLRPLLATPENIYPNHLQSLTPDDKHYLSWNVVPHATGYEIEGIDKTGWFTYTLTEQDIAQKCSNGVCRLEFDSIWTTQPLGEIQWDVSAYNSEARSLSSSITTFYNLGATIPIQVSDLTKAGYDSSDNSLDLSADKPFKVCFNNIYSDEEEHTAIEFIVIVKDVNDELIQLRQEPFSWNPDTWCADFKVPSSGRYNLEIIQVVSEDNGKEFIFSIAQMYEHHLLLTEADDGSGGDDTGGDGVSGLVACFGCSNYGECAVPEGLGKVKAISAGNSHSLAIKQDGTLVAWGGWYTYNNYGQGKVPEELSHVKVKAISAGYGHSLILQENGNVAAWGRNSSGQCTVPEGLTNVKAIAAGNSHSLALKEDGTIVAWGGTSYYGEGTVPEELSQVKFKAISAGNELSLALKEDGTVVAWGSNSQGQSTVPQGLNQVKAISAGWYHSLALKEDGTVVAWGANDNNLSTIPEELTQVKAISAGTNNNIVLQEDGTALVWGRWFNCLHLPMSVSQSIAIAAGGGSSFMVIRQTESKNVSFVSENLPDGTYHIGSANKRWRFKNGDAQLSGLKAVRVSADSDLGITVSEVGLGDIAANAEFVVEVPVNPVRNSKAMPKSVWKFVDGIGNDVAISNSSTNTFWVALRTNRPPSFSPLQLGSIGGTSGSSLTLPLLAEDKDGDFLTFYVVSGGGSISDNKWWIGSFSNNNTEIKRLVLAVSDGMESANKNIDVVVYGINGLSNFFTDVPASTSPNSIYAATHFLAGKGIVIGHSVEGSSTQRAFKPNDLVSQAEALKMLLLSAQERGILELVKAPEIPDNLMIADPVSGIYQNYTWAATYAYTAFQHGMIDSVEEWKPAAPVSRIELARWLNALLNLKVPLALLDANNLSDQYQFTDASAFASDADYRIARQAAFFSYLGKLGQNFNPDGKLQRGEFAVVAAKVLRAPSIDGLVINGTTIGTRFGMEMPVITHGQTLSIIGVKNLVTREILIGGQYVLEEWLDQSKNYVKIGVALSDGKSLGAMRYISELSSSPLTIDTGKLNISTDTQLTLIVLIQSKGSESADMERSGVAAVYYFPVAVDFPDSDGDYVRDDLDIWSQDWRFSSDTNNNSYPDEIDDYLAVLGLRPDQFVVIDGVTQNYTYGELLMDNDTYTPPEDNDVNTWLILKKDTPPFYIPYNGKVEIAKGSESAAIRIAQGAYVNFEEFSGTYVVIFEEDSSQFMGERLDNNRINLTSNNGTVVNMVVSTSSHMLYFNDGSADLFLSNDTIILGEHEIWEKDSVECDFLCNNDKPPTYSVTILPDKVNTYLVLTDDSANFTIPYGAYTKIYGSTGVNTITLESGAFVECMNFVGSNVINLKDISSGFKAYRSGATVYLENSTTRTLLKIPATKTSQLLNFANLSLVLSIINNKVFIGNNEITENESQLFIIPDQGDEDL